MTQFILDALSRVEPKDQDKDVTLAQAFTIQIDPHEADVFIGYSTTPGKVSPINPRHGTHYFQVLSTYLQDYYKSKPLDLIYTLVTDVVTKRVHLIDEHDGMYVPQKVSTLRATLYLTATPQNKVLHIHVMFVLFMLAAEKIFLTLSVCWSIHLYSAF